MDKRVINYQLHLVLLSYGSQHSLAEVLHPVHS